MADLTPERLAELRRIAEAATPGPWRISHDGPADRFVVASAEREHIAETKQGGSFPNEDLANAHHIATFDPPTVFALLDEIERLRREREVLVEAVTGWQRYLERDVGTEIVHVRTLEAHGRALALIAGEKGGGDDSAESKAEIERLRREREVLAEAFKHVWTCDDCECASCPEGTGLVYRAYRALGGALSCTTHDAER